MAVRARLLPAAALLLVAGCVGDLTFDAGAPDAGTTDLARLDAASDAATLPDLMLPAGENWFVSPNGDDANDGSAGKPWRTLQHACDTVVAAPAGDAVVHVAPGSYPQTTITCSTSGAMGRRIRFVSDAKWGAKVVSTTGDTHSIAWTVSADYVDVEGFDVTGDGRIGILVLGSFDRMVGNHVHDIPNLGQCANGVAIDPSGGAGIDDADYSAHDDDLIGNWVHDIGDATQPCPTVQGLYHSNLRGTIVSNVSFHNTGFGIHTWHAAQYVTISGNTVFDNGKSGIIVGAGDSPGGVTADYFVVTDNVLVHNREYGIIEYGTTGPHNRYIDNLAFSNVAGATSLMAGVTEMGTLTSDPLFVSYQPDGSGDYHLAAGSPAIDSGTMEGAPAIDFDGAPRPSGADFDRGAFERGAVPRLWPWM
jgi:hypothetical protein